MMASPVTAALLVFAATAAAYSGAVGHDLLTWDDERFIIRNEDVQLSGLPAVSVVFDASRHIDPQSEVEFYPVRDAIYAAIYSIWGAAPLPFHLLNVLLHASVAVLLFLLLRGRGLGSPFAAFSALAFSLHPVNVESAAWISETKNLGSSLFALLALWRFAAFTANRGPCRDYLLSLLFLLLGLLAKAQIVPFFGIMALYALCFSPPGRKLKDAAFCAPHAVLCTIFAVFHAWLFSLHGQAGRFAEQGLARTLAFTVTLVGKYAATMVSPSGLKVIYTMSPVESLSDPRFLLAAPFVFGFAVAAILLARKLPAFTFLSGAFFVSLTPVIHLVPTIVDMADRYAYIPSMAFACGLGLAAEAAYSRLRGARPVLGPAVAAACCLYLAFEAGLTLLRVRIWKDNVSLWSAAVKESPDLEAAWFNLADAFIRAGELHRAEKIYRKVILPRGEAAPTEETLHSMVNLGSILLDTGRTEEAGALIRKALSLSPNDLPANFGMGAYLLAKEMPQEALPHLLLAVSGMPRNRRFIDTAARTLQALGRHEEAAELLEK